MRKITSGLCAIVFSLGLANPRAQVVINEIVVDPQQDRTEDSLITGSDEYFELFNSSDKEINLSGWRLELIDTTSEDYEFGNVKIPAGDFFVVVNPRGQQNNNGRLKLYDNGGGLVDAVSYGDWSGNDINIPDGNASGLENEALCRFPDGSNNWVKTYATPGRSNVSSGVTRLSIEKIVEGVKVSVEGGSGKNVVLERVSSLDGGWMSVYTAVPPYSFEDSPKSTEFYRAREEE